MSSMTLLVLGPSGVGKTTLICAAAARYDLIRTLDVDNEVKRLVPHLYFHNGNLWQEFWEFSKAHVIDMKARFTAYSHLLIVDLGAGCLEANVNIEDIKQIGTVAAIHDLPKEAYRKAANRPNSFWSTRSLEEYCAAEFSDRRQILYSAADLKIDIGGLSRDAAINTFTAAVVSYAQTVGIRLE